MPLKPDRRTPTLADLVQALLATWQQSCESVSAAHEAALADARLDANDEAQLLVFQGQMAGWPSSSEPLRISAAELFRRTSYRPRDLRLSFDCVLVPSAVEPWQIRIVGAGRLPALPSFLSALVRSVVPTKRRHRMEIVIDGYRSPRASVWFDGEILWRVAMSAAGDIETGINP